MRFHIRRLVTLIGSLLFATLCAAAQQPSSSTRPLPAPGSVITTNDPSVTITFPSQTGVSLPVRDLPVTTGQATDTRTVHRRIMKKPSTQPRAQSTPGAQPDAALQPFIGVALAANPGLNFDGIGQGVFNFQVGSSPPDPSGAVGLTQYVQWVNTSFAVFDKATGNKLSGPTAGNMLWHGFGGPCETHNDGDPIVQFDKLANRWVMTQFAVVDANAGPFLQCVAVSKTSDATGAFNLYAYPMTAQNLQQPPATVPSFNDFPKVGIWPNAYFMSFNMFNNASEDPINTISFGEKACAFDRNAMLHGLPVAAMVCKQLFPNQEDSTLYPADLDGTTLPPAGSPGYYMTVQTNANSLTLYTYTVDFTDPANPVSNFVFPGTVIPVANFAALGAGDFVPQPGLNSPSLDSLTEEGLSFRLAYRNFSDHESLVINHTVSTNAGDPGGNPGAIRWYEIRNPGHPNVFQQGTFGPDGTTRWLGSIAMDKLGDLLAGYALSDVNNVNPSIGITGRVPADPAGTMENETIVAQGGRVLNDDRYGDYSQMTVDPIDNCNFWYTQEYVKAATQAAQWNTRIATFKFPSCANTADFSLSENPTLRRITGGESNTYTITVSPMAGFNGVVTFSASGLPQGVTATFNPATVTASGSTTLTLTTISTTKAGNYTFNVTGANGTTSHSNTLLLIIDDYSLQVAPPSQTIDVGDSTTYTVTVTPVNGFQGTVTFSASGLPDGATATFNPASVTGAGQTTMTVNTVVPASTGGGDFTITVTGTTAGGATRTATTALHTKDFSLFSTPTLQVIAAGNSTQYAMNLSTINQFSDLVALSVTAGLPANTTATFNPTSISGSTSSTLTISTVQATPVGNSTFTVSGTNVVNGASGKITRTLPVSLTVTDFSLNATPASQTITPGNGTSYSVTAADVGGFGFPDNINLTLNANLPAGVQGTFSPNPIRIGQTSTLTITSTSATPTGSITLTITGTDVNDIHTASVTLDVVPPAPAACISPASLSFGNQNVGTTSAAQNVALVSCGGQPLALSSITTSGDFSQTNNCPASLVVGAGCTIQVTFTPTVTGSRAGALTISDNAQISLQQVSLNGTGTAPVVSLSPASLSFGNQNVGSTSAAQTVTLSNTGTGPLAISSITTTAGDFAQTNNCPASLAAGANCAIQVTFSPTVTGSRTGTLKVTDNAAGSPQQVSLSGTGTTPVASLSPATLSFGNQNVGSTSAAQTVTLSNTGTSALVISSIATTGDFAQSSNCPASLAAGANCAIQVTFNPTAAGSRTGTLKVTDNASGSPQQVSLSGTGTTPVASLSPATLSFGNQNVGSTSAAQTVTLSNTGTGPLTISSIATTGDFAQTNNCGTTLAAGANCAIQVTFKPTAAGARTGTLSVTDNAAGSPQQVSLSGTGTTPVASVSPATLSFGNQNVGTTSAAQTVTLSNTGTGPLTINSIATTGDFGQTNNCGSTLAAGANCAIQVTFSPTATGSRTGTLSVTDNVAGSPQQVSLSGTGTTPVASVSPATLSFGNQNVGTTSAAQTVTLSNTGTGPLTISSITTTGDFAQTNNCPASLAAGANCTIQVTLTPTATGSRTGTLSVTDNAAGSPQQVSLSGTGTTPVASVSPATLSFGNQNVGTTSAAQTVTLSNTGTGPLTISSIAATGDFAQTNNCGTALAAGTNCAIQVTFNPTATGSRTGTLSVTDNAAGSPQQVSLSGTGTTPVASVSPATLSFGNQNVGTTSAAQTVTLSNTGTGLLTISSIAATGDFAQTNNCGTTLAAGANCSIQVTFNPTVTGSRTGTLSVTDNAAGSPQQVSLSGTGTAPVASFSPASLSFGNQNLNTTSAAQTVTLSNTGTSALVISSIAITGDFAQSNNCPASLAVGANCAIQVTFTPTTTGSRTGTLSVTDNAAGSPQQVSLTGTGVIVPVITSLSPASGPSGPTPPVAVTIAGSHFGTAQGTSTVTFAGISAPVTSWSDGSIGVTVPSGLTAGNVSVVVTVGGVASSAATFTVFPTITGISANSGSVGTSVTITGTSFGGSQGSSTVTFNGTAGIPTAWSAGSITVPVPSGATSGNVVVTVNGQASNGVQFTVAAPAPTITSVSPTSGPVGTTVTVNGTNFGDPSNPGTVFFSGPNGIATPAPLISWGPTSVVVTVPTGAQTGRVRMSVNGQFVSGPTFTVTPSISSLSPTSGPVGTSVTVSGANFGKTQGSSTITFNGTLATPASWSDQSITVPVPAGATTGNVVVTVGANASNGVQFTVQ